MAMLLRASVALVASMSLVGVDEIRGQDPAGASRMHRDGSMPYDKDDIPPYVTAIADGLKSPDANSRKAAIDQIKSLVSSNPREVRRYLRSKWMPQLLKLHEYDAVTTTAHAVLLQFLFDSSAVSSMQSCKVQAAMKAGDPASALREAKRYYNVASIAETGVAIDAFVDALQLGDDGDSRAKSFRLQQLAGESFDSDLSKPATMPSSLGSNLLRFETPIDDTVEKQLRQLESPPPHKFQDYTSVGNALLLLDRPSEAETAFRSALAVASPMHTKAAIENVARAIRAEDGSIGRANAYLKSLQSGH